MKCFSCEEVIKTGDYYVIQDNEETDEPETFCEECFKRLYPDWKLYYVIFRRKVDWLDGKRRS